MLVDEMQHTRDVDLWEGIKQGVVHGLTPTGILDDPPDLPTAAGELDMRISPEAIRRFTSARRLSRCCSSAASCSWMGCWRSGSPVSAIKVSFSCQR